MRQTTSLLGLTLTLPGANTTPRTKAWRALKAAGAAVLRDGLYVLPESPASESTLTSIGADILASGGTAELLTLTPRDAEQAQRFIALFDRRDAFAELVAQCHALLASPSDGGDPEKRLRALQQQFAQLVAIDFFPGEAQANAATALDHCTRQLSAWLSPGEPGGSAANPVRQHDRAVFQHRTWATRARPRIDRLASAWLICRHIDTSPRFLWLASPADCPTDAVGFDFDHATFTHVGDLVTFEHLLASFALDQNIALQRIAALVHVLDVGGAPVVPEAAGFAAVLNGLRENEPDDDRLLAAALPVFDALATFFASTAR